MGNTGARAQLERPANTGLVYYRSCYYDPLVSCFTQPDTIIPNPSNPQDLNRYSYVRNNPVRYTDPTGNYVIGNDGASCSGTVGCRQDYARKQPNGSTFVWGSTGTGPYSGTSVNLGSACGRLLTPCGEPGSAGGAAARGLEDGLSDFTFSNCRNFAGGTVREGDTNGDGFVAGPDGLGVCIDFCRGEAEFLTPTRKQEHFESFLYADSSKNRLQPERLDLSPLVPDSLCISGFAAAGVGVQGSACAYFDDGVDLELNGGTAVGFGASVGVGPQWRTNTAAGTTETVCAGGALVTAGASVCQSLAPYPAPRTGYDPDNDAEGTNFGLSVGPGVGGYVGVGLSHVWDLDD